MVQRIEQTNSQLELGYWAIRGLAQPIRYLLTFADVAFSEVRLGIHQDGTLVEDEAADWSTHRETLAVDFPNLPYLIDSSGPDVARVTQSNAVLRYLARRFDFYGDTEVERLTIDVIQEEAYDLRNWIVKTAYTLGDQYPAAFDEFTATPLPRYLDGLERYLSRRAVNTHFVGDRISLVDFVLYELLWQCSVMVVGSITDTYRSNLYHFIESFAARPRIAAYMASEHYIERPINSPWASFT